MADSMFEDMDVAPLDGGISFAEWWAGILSSLISLSLSLSLSLSVSLYGGCAHVHVCSRTCLFAQVQILTSYLLRHLHRRIFFLKILCYEVIAKQKKKLRAIHHYWTMFRRAKKRM